MNIGEQLDEIKDQAGKDPKLYEAFLETRTENGKKNHQKPAKNQEKQKKENGKI